MVQGDLQNKELVGDTWSPTASMRTTKYFLADAVKHKTRVYQLDFIGSFLQAKVKNRLFVKLNSIYADYFPKHSIYCGRSFRLLKYMYGSDIEWLIKAGYVQYQCQMSIYYKYAPYGTKIVVYLML